MLYENIWDFFRSDCRLTFKSSVPFAVVYLLCIPLVRGIGNLNEVQSADCLLQSVSLAGIILIVPILRGELQREIREVVQVKKWGYRRTVCIRLALSFGITAVMIGGFAAGMQSKGCVFPFWRVTLATVGCSLLMGSAGLLAAWAGKSLAAGYLAALGCYGAFAFLGSGIMY